MAKLCRKALVSGKVQGVFYRASTRQKAQELGVTGYAKNLPDGRVEVLACGYTQQVNDLLDWLQIGPPASHVDTVEVFETDLTEAHSFEVL